MEPQAPLLEATIAQAIQKNVARWQDVENPLAPLSDSQMDILFQVEDVIKQLYFEGTGRTVPPKEKFTIQTNNDFVIWMVKLEDKIKDETHSDFLRYSESLRSQSQQCSGLRETTQRVITYLVDLETRHQKVVAKTDSLHILSEELMRHQTELKYKSLKIEEKLRYFTLYENLRKSIERLGSNINCEEFLSDLDQIDLALQYFAENPNFKETFSYKIKYESLLVTALQGVFKIIQQVIGDATHQVMIAENRSLLPVNPDAESAFSFYYGKYENVAGKVSGVTKYIEDKSQPNNTYAATLEDCQKTYFTQRSSIMVTAVSAALSDLRDKHKAELSILFRSAVLFVMKICQDETMCFRYFFSNHSPALGTYLGSLCQILYDMLRPCLINVNHLEVLTELCTILKQMLNDQIQSNVSLDQLVEIIMQLVHDVEERLVFRTNIFFQHDLLKYEPSPGDLAYPEKLREIEDITDDISDRRSESRMSVPSVSVNLSANYTGQFRSYTGNSPADLHGMWYPTVKRTLVCLSRLYICLDREIFQGLAQEALIICIRTVDDAAEKISARKTPVDGKLFHIKHLLIIREQIAPFQVDFTAKEMSLDFSTVRSAAVGFIQNRDKLFTFSSNNAILEFLLEGTPKVKEYLIDSRKEIDKQLKHACESFISDATDIFVGDILRWLQKAAKVLKMIASETTPASLKEQEFGRPKNVAEMLAGVLRNIKFKIPEIQKAMRLYLANRETEFILFKPIKDRFPDPTDVSATIAEHCQKSGHRMDFDNVKMLVRNNILNSFIELEQILASGGYTKDDQLLVACPSTEQINVLICSVSLSADSELAQSRMSYSR